MKNATLRQLKTFVAVAQQLSFSAAARQLHLTQPAISEQIKQLEGHVGLPLFEKLGKRIHLTRAGVQMLHHSQSIIGEFDRAEQAMTDLREQGQKRLKVGLITTGSYLLPHLLAEFVQQHEGVELEMSVHNRERLLQMLEANQIDLALMVGATRPPSLQAQPFAPHPFVMVASPRHPLARARNIPMQTLRGERLLVRESGSDTWQSMREHLPDTLLADAPTLEIRSTEAIKQAAMAGMGVAYLSAHAIAMEMHAGMLSILDVQGLPVIEQWQVVHHGGKQLDGVAGAFKAFLIDRGGELLTRLADVEHWSDKSQLRAPIDRLTQLAVHYA